MCGLCVWHDGDATACVTRDDAQTAPQHAMQRLQWTTPITTMQLQCNTRTTHRCNAISSWTHCWTRIVTIAIASILQTPCRCKCTATTQCDATQRKHATATRGRNGHAFRRAARRRRPRREKTPPHHHDLTMTSSWYLTMMRWRERPPSHHDTSMTLSHYLIMARWREGPPSHRDIIMTSPWHLIMARWREGPPSHHAITMTPP